jgi:peptidoglycan/xylan/chitin deacetylase (PgdA/CDA1 family)
MSLRNRIGDCRREALNSLFRRDVSIESSTPLVSFSFDDFPKAALTVGGSILKSYGVRGTYYAAYGLMGTETEVGNIFTRADLSLLLEDGHELGTHTYSHLPARRASVNAFRQDLEKGYEALVREFGSNVSHNFSYPLGQVTLRVKKKVAPALNSCRGIHRGLNWPTSDLNLLRANCVYGGPDKFPELRSLIELNSRKNSWLIFYTHDVGPNPSPYGCTPELFSQVVNYSLQCGSRIATIGEVVKMATPVR